MELWEDYEKIVLLKELLKLCGAENLGFLASHIQQQYVVLDFLKAKSNFCNLILTTRTCIV